MIRWNVIGLDLSLTSTGIATPDGTSLVRSKARGMQRLDQIASAVLTAVAQLSGPDAEPLVVVEGYAFGRPNQAAHLGELGGVVRHWLWKIPVAYVDVPPATLKKYATGKGNASKEEMLVAAVRRLGYEGSSNDEADALWLRAFGCDGIGEPIVDMPALNRVALSNFSVPEGFRSPERFR